MNKIIFSIFILSTSILFAQQKNGQQEVDVLYNAAVEKYIKNDYDKSVEYMEKVYSLSKEQKYKNFIIKILYEAANNNYMKQNYTKAYEYTSKALKYTTDDEKINQLHRILKDLIEKEEMKGKKFFKESTKQETSQVGEQNKEVQKEEKKTAIQKKQEEYKIKPTTHSIVFPTQPQVQIVENKKYKILFYALLSLIILAIIIVNNIWIRYNIKTKNTLQQNISSLQQENLQLKTSLLESNKEIELLTKETQIYKEYIKKYEEEIKEKSELIKSLQNQLSLLSKEKMLPKQQVASTYSSGKQQKEVFSVPVSFSENIFDKQQKEVLEYFSKLPQSQIQSEYELELYREKIASMLKLLYELNPQKTYSILENMVKSDNPIIRMNVIASLAEIATEETFSILFSLYKNDADPKVRGEVLKHLIRVKNKIDSQQISLPEEIKQKVISIVKQEKSKGEWFF